MAITPSPNSRGALATTVLRSIAVLIAIGAAIDPAITSARHTRPLVSVVAADVVGDSALLTRVTTALETAFTVVRAPLDNAAGTVLVGDRVPLSIRDGTSPVLVLSSRDATSPSLQVRRVVAPSRAPLDARVAVSMTIAAERASGTAGAAQTVQLELVHGERVVSREQIRLDRDSVVTRALTFVPTRAETVILEARAFLVGGADTLRHALLVEVHDTRWSVLFFDRRPSWMSTFVRRAIERDPRFAVTSRIITSTNVSRETGTAPLSLDAITAAGAFDAVVVGAPDALTARDVDGLSALLRTRGASVLVLADQAAVSPLDGLLGFGGWRTAPRRIPTAIVSLLGNAGVGAVREPLRLKGLAIGTPSRLPSNAEVIAVLAGDSSGAAQEPRRAPVIWRMPVGVGQIIVSGAFDAWHYRDTAQSTFDATWRDLIDEAASARRPAIDLALSRMLVEPRTALSATLTARPGSDLMATSLLLRRARADSTWDTPHSLDARGTASERVASFRAPLTPGRYELLATRGTDSARVPLVVASHVFQDGEDNPALVRAWAESRGGRVLEPSRVAELVETMRSVVHAVPVAERWHPLRSPWWIVPFACALAGEWWLRRRRGLA